MSKPFDKDISETLAVMECYAEMSDGDEDDARFVTVFRRILREAGYDIPAEFDWQEYMPESF